MGSRALRIDLHTHILPESWADLEERYGYGGFLRLESKPGAGTTVTVEFPAERSIAQPAGPRQSQTAPSAAPPIPPKPGKRRATRSADPIATAVRASGA